MFSWSTLSTCCRLVPQKISTRSCWTAAQHGTRRQHLDLCPGWKLDFSFVQHGYTAAGLLQNSQRPQRKGQIEGVRLQLGWKDWKPLVVFNSHHLLSPWHSFSAYSHCTFPTHIGTLWQESSVGIWITWRDKIPHILCLNIVLSPASLKHISSSIYHQCTRKKEAFTL